MMMMMMMMMICTVILNTCQWLFAFKSPTITSLITNLLLAIQHRLIRPPFIPQAWLRQPHILGHNFQLPIALVVILVKTENSSNQDSGQIFAATGHMSGSNHCSAKLELRNYSQSHGARFVRLRRLGSSETRYISYLGLKRDLQNISERRPSQFHTLNS